MNLGGFFVFSIFDIREIFLKKIFLPEFRFGVSVKQLYSEDFICPRHNWIHIRWDFNSDDVRKHEPR